MCVVNDFNLQHTGFIVYFIFHGVIFLFTPFQSIYPAVQRRVGKIMMYSCLIDWHSFFRGYEKKDYYISLKKSAFAGQISNEVYIYLIPCFTHQILQIRELVSSHLLTNGLRLFLKAQSLPFYIVHKGFHLGSQTLLLPFELQFLFE